MLGHHPIRFWISWSEVDPRHLYFKNQKTKENNENPNPNKQAILRSTQDWEPLQMKKDKPIFFGEGRWGQKRQRRKQGVDEVMGGVAGMFYRLYNNFSCEIVIGWVWEVRIPIFMKTRGKNECVASQGRGSREPDWAWCQTAGRLHSVTVSRKSWQVLLHEAQSPLDQIPPPIS